MVPVPAAPLAALRRLVVDSLGSRHSRQAYGRAVDAFLAWYGSAARAGFSRAVVQEYRAVLEAAGFAPSTINVRLAAIRKLAGEAADNGVLAPEIASGILRVRGVRSSGVRAGNWLTAQQASQLLEAPDPGSPKGRRDRAILALLVGCGLRRSELVQLEFRHLQQRENRWVLVDLVGKGNRIRTVAVPEWVKDRIDRWTLGAGLRTGRIFRALNKAGAVAGEELTEKVVWWVVREHAGGLGWPNLAPHDLRRTCAKLCRAAGGELEQIQFLLGHASIQTTERYLGSRQALSPAVNDRLDLGPLR